MAAAGGIYNIIRVIKTGADHCPGNWEVMLGRCKVAFGGKSPKIINTTPFLSNNLPAAGEFLEFLGFSVWFSANS